MHMKFSLAAYIKRSIVVDCTLHPASEMLTTDATHLRNQIQHEVCPSLAKLSSVTDSAGPSSRSGEQESECQGVPLYTECRSGMHGPAVCS